MNYIEKQICKRKKAVKVLDIELKGTNLLMATEIKKKKPLTIKKRSNTSFLF